MHRDDGLCEVLAMSKAADAAPHPSGRYRLYVRCPSTASAIPIELRLDAIDDRAVQQLRSVVCPWCEDTHWWRLATLAVRDMKGRVPFRVNRPLDPRIDARTLADELARR
jgi:hypothetical protein